jgi:hypothetical protein
MGLAAAVGVAAVGNIASSVISSGATGRAADAATAAADQSAAVQREQLNAAKTALNPYNQAGIPATNAINSLLGLGSVTQSQQLPTPQPNALSQFFPNGGAMASDGVFTRGSPIIPTGPTGIGYGMNQPWQGQTVAGAQPLAANPPMSQRDYVTAFGNYRNSTGYNFRLGEGMKALNSGYSGAGTFQSGARDKAAIEYGQNMGSGEFSNYLTALGNQQALGLSAGSALAGVGQNYANSLSTINSNRADAIGNAALVSGRNTSNAIGDITGTILKYAPFK